MKYVQVKNWRKHQSYTGKFPSWIRIYRALLNPLEEEKYTALSDGAKLTLLHLWLLASSTDNRTPLAWITSDRLNMQTRPKLKEIEDAGFVIIRESVIDCVDAPVIDDVNNNVCLSGSVSDSDSFDQEEAFSRVWADILANPIPKPVRKSFAFKHYVATVKDAETHERVLKSLAFYRSSARVARGWIQDASTWFNNWSTWETNPDPVTEVKRDRSNRTSSSQSQAAPRESLAAKFGHRSIEDVLKERELSKVSGTPTGGSNDPVC